MEPNPPKVDEKLAREVHVIATQPTNDAQYQRLTLAMLVAAASLAGVVLGFCLGFGLNSQSCRTNTHAVAPAPMMATAPHLNHQAMPLLGVVFSQANRPGGQPGATISSVIPKTAAAKIGLRAGDVIQRVGDIDVVRSVDLLRAVRNHAAGELTTVRYCRGESCATEAVILGKFRSEAIRSHRRARYQHRGLR